MKPSVGRIVHFRNPNLDEKNETLDRLCNGGRCVAAIIVGVDVFGDFVSLDVRWPWTPEGLRDPVYAAVSEGTAPGTWHWPERVE